MRDKTGYLIVLDKEAIVSEERVNDVQPISTWGELDNLLLQPLREEPIGVDGHHCQRSLDGAECLRDSASTTSEIEKAHRIGECDVGIGVESAG
jgi:hypothetical protein